MSTPTRRPRRSGSPLSKLAVRLLGYLLAYLIGVMSAGVGFLAAVGMHP